MKIKATKQWTRIKWPYNDASPYSEWECWQLGNYILHPGQWPNEGWSYVAAFGHTSDRSYSGFLQGIVDLKEAKRRIEKIREQEKRY